MSKVPTWRANGCHRWQIGQMVSSSHREPADSHRYRNVQVQIKIESFRILNGILLSTRMLEMPKFLDYRSLAQREREMVRMRLESQAQPKLFTRTHKGCPIFQFSISNFQFWKSISFRAFLWYHRAIGLNQAKQKQFPNLKTSIWKLQFKSFSLKCKKVKRYRFGSSFLIRITSLASKSLWVSESEMISVKC